ncbi:hypothetical protein [Phyllobacterium ifriqiyense]|uniref:hypothetical protein n=1 Tax=Phyllobacterium ifriqiyense TaxID=314238 RepID=UPI00339B0485
MRFAVLIACLIQAITSASKANGDTPQNLFADNAIWIHWTFALFWLYIGITAAWKGVE